MRSVVGLLLATTLGFAGCVSSIALVPPPPAAACGSTVILGPDGLPMGDVAGYSGEQLSNAAAIINVGGVLGVPARAQLVAVMTAMGESGLRVLDRGDAVGPDSRGLFQQRDNGAWGSYADRMDPTTSATNFYRALLRVEGWETLPPTLAAHRTQRNADPYHYERYWPAALEVVGALAGAPVPATPDCTPAPGDITTEGWIKPAVGRTSSTYGWRVHPITGRRKMHNGVDIAAPCGTPIYAAGPGVVVRAGPAASYGTLVSIDHGGGVISGYAHMYNADVLTSVGTQVSGGTLIGRIGSNGDSTGCHLHFQVQQQDQFIDPVPFLKTLGVVF